MSGSQGIEPVQRSTAYKRQRPARPWAELFLCVIGSLVTLQLAGIGTFAMVFGAWLLSRPEEGKASWAIAGCLAPGVALSLVSFVDYGSLVLPCAVCALVIARLLPGRITVTTVCATIAAVAAMLVGADALFAHANGMDLLGYMDAVIDSAYEITAESVSQAPSTVASQAAVEQVYETARKVWPLGYVLQATVIVLLGLLGLVVARRDGYRDVYGSFARYDVPLWGVAALIVGIVLLMLGTSGQGEQLESIGLMLLLVLRVLFFLQGMAVAIWWMGRRGMGFVSRVLVLSMLLLAEMAMFVVSVFGVVDVWANFRRLPRKDDVAKGDEQGA